MVNLIFFNDSKIICNVKMTAFSNMGNVRAGDRATELSPGFKTQVGPFF